MRTGGRPESGWTLFLDFDGVLNNDPFLRHQRSHGDPDEHRIFDPQNIDALNRLCASLPVTSIVITSTWRLQRGVDTLRGLLSEGCFSYAELVHAVTPVLETRAEEIREFLVAHPRERWLILDDMNLGDQFGDRCFLTSPAAGLTEEVCDAVLLSLQGGPPAA